jgi:hypothetical protein
VSATECLGWPPALGNGARTSGQTKKRSGAADLEIHQGSLNGGAKSCRVWRRSLNEGKPNPASLGDREQSPGGDGGGFQVAKGERGASWNLRLHGQDVSGGFTESVPYEA